MFGGDVGIINTTTLKDIPNKKILAKGSVTVSSTKNIFSCKPHF